jgi:tRNA threonylcarbamoyladenosine biosynthesis protein TsaB
MKLLALETATDACSVALYLDGDIREDFRIAPRAHTQLLLPMAEGLLQQAGLRPADLDALAFGRGPGAFTGVRIATAVVQGLAYALDLPVLPVSTLAALAQGAQRQYGWQQIACAMDARMDEVYWGAYVRDEHGLMVLQGEECVCPPVATPNLQGDWYGCGSGWTAYADLLRARHPQIALSQQEDWPHAQDVATLAVAALARGEGLSAAEALPVYLRDQVVHRAG